MEQLFIEVECATTHPKGGSDLVCKFKESMKMTSGLEKMGDALTPVLVSGQSLILEPTKLIA